MDYDENVVDQTSVSWLALLDLVMIVAVFGLFVLAMDGLSEYITLKDAVHPCAAVTL